MKPIFFQIREFTPYLEVPLKKNGEKKWDMPKTAREIYKSLPPAAFYPEHLDVTFDFAPRMCEHDSRGSVLSDLLASHL
jgi:hypothetical protein